MQATIYELLEKLFRQAFELSSLNDDALLLQASSRAEHGDFQINGVMAAAKSRRINPRELAAKVIAQIGQNDIIESLEVAGPGFINIRISNKFLSNHLTIDALKPHHTKSQTIVVDYSAPNLAKEMHVGHLRSTIIGDSLVRIYEYLGHKVIKRNHVGDWGTQFGMLVAYLSEINHDSNDTVIGLNDLEVFYRTAKIRFDEDADFAAKSRLCVVKLQSGDLEMLKLWQQFVTTSLMHCQHIYEKLTCKLVPEDAVGESSYNELLPFIVKLLTDKSIAVDSEGAKCIFFAAEELGTNDETPLIIQKKDGGYLYATTDLAAIYDRVINLHAHKLVYVIDSRQALHMKQIFAVARKAELASSEIILQHANFGTMMGEDNRPFKTRSGDTVKLINLIDEAIIRAQAMVRQRNPQWNDAEINQLAESIAISSIKYADLSKNRTSDYVFSFDKMLSFEGNTAPYLLYAYTRIISIFKKSGLELSNYLSNTLIISQPEEHNLAIHLLKFRTLINKAATEAYPHYICNYVYELAGLFMRFYESCPILKAENQNLINSRLELAALSAEALKTGLNLLGIEVVDKM